MGAMSRFHVSPIERFRYDRNAELARYRLSTNPMQQAVIANEIARLDFHIARLQQEQYAATIAAEAEDQDVDF
jgi:hypothetical protein